MQVKEELMSNEQLAMGDGQLAPLSSLRMIGDEQLAPSSSLRMIGNGQLAPSSSFRMIGNGQLAASFSLRIMVIKQFVIIILGIGCCLLLFTSCNSPYMSKKRGYFQIELPQRGYQKFEKEGFPYSFEYPTYARIIQDSTFFDTNPENPYWINIDFPQFRGRIFLSYKIVGGNVVYRVKKPDGKYKDSSGINVFDRMVADAFTLTNKNDVVSTSIKDSLIQTDNNISGVFFKVGGNAATAKQFFLSDTTKNFIRGALYFDVTPNADSLRPVQDFLQTDLEHMINTFKWKNK
jgi:gliding motility-associated lipoprotein GldD